jgi:hypothetical protein
MTESREQRVWAGWVVILLVALLYFATLDTGLRPDELSGGDLITHQYAQVQARPSNAPGYPLYTMGGWLWFRMTRPLLGWALNPVQRLASYSMLWGLLSLFILYRLALHTTRGNWPVSSLLTAFYATTYFFWFYSVTTEQYTSAIFQTLLIVWLAFEWDKAQSQGKRDDHYLLWIALAVGTCLANLVTTLFILPPLIWFVLIRRPDLSRRPATIIRMGAVALVPLASYAYVYARGAAHPEWRGTGQWPNTGAWFVNFLTTQQGRDELAPGLTLTRFFTTEYPSLIWGELTWIVLIGGLIGLWWLGRSRALFLYSTLAIYLIFCWADRFGNWFQVILPTYPLFVLGFATGLNVLWSMNWQTKRKRLGMRSLIVAGLVALVAYRLTVSLPRANQSHRPEDTGLAPGWEILADKPLAYSIVLAEHSEWLALDYLVNIWGVEPPIYPRPLCQTYAPIPTDISSAPTGISAIYITRRAAATDTSCLAEKHRYAAGFNLIQVQDLINTQLPESSYPASVEFGSELTLAGLEASISPNTGQKEETGWEEGHPGYADARWHLSLYWRAQKAMDVDYTISVRPLRDEELLPGRDGKPLIQDHQPVWNSYPTSRWSPGEVVRDDYALYLPEQIVPDGVRVVVYRDTAEGLANLAEADLALTP